MTVLIISTQKCSSPMRIADRRKDEACGCQPDEPMAHYKSHYNIYDHSAVFLWPHFADDVFISNFLHENIWILIKISMKFVPKGPINIIPALVQIMAWRRPGDKPLSEPMMVSLTTHICVTGLNELIMHTLVYCSILLGIKLLLLLSLLLLLILLLLLLQLLLLLWDAIDVCSLPFSVSAHGWLSARLQYLHRVSNVDTAGLY